MFNAVSKFEVFPSDILLFTVTWNSMEEVKSSKLYGGGRRGKNARYRSDVPVAHQLKKCYSVFF